MHHRCKSWRKPIHARKGNSLWARIDNFGKIFVIARAHLSILFCLVLYLLPGLRAEKNEHGEYFKTSDQHGKGQKDL